MKATNEILSAIEAEAVNEHTRAAAESGLELTYEQADALGSHLDWFGRRFGLSVEETDRGVNASAR